MQVCLGFSGFSIGSQNHPSLELQANWHLVRASRRKARHLLMHLVKSGLESKGDCRSIKQNSFIKPWLPKTKSSNPKCRQHAMGTFEKKW